MNQAGAGKATTRPAWVLATVLLTLGWFVIWQYRATLTPVLPLVSAFFGGATDGQLGIISSSCFFGNLLMQIPSGMLVDRFGRRAVLVPGLLVFAAGACVVGMAPSLPVLYVGSFIAGVGSGTYYGIAYSLVVEMVPERHRGLATACVSSGVALGSGIGMILSSRLVGTGMLPWQALIFVASACAVVLALAFSRILGTGELARIAAGAGARRGAAEQGEQSGSPEPARGIGRFFTLPMVATYVIYFATCYLYYIIDTWLPNLLETERGFAGGIVGLVSSLVYFSAIPGSVLVGRLVDAAPQQRKRFILVLELAAAGIVFVLVGTASQGVLVGSIVAYGLLGKLTVEPIIIAWFGKLAPAGSLATTYTVLNFFAALASVAAPAMTGLISDATGSKASGLYLAVGILLVATVLFALVRRREEARA